MQSAHSEPIAYLPVPHGRRQAPALREAPEPQSESRKAVLGVGSTHLEAPAPLHSWHAASHAWQLPVALSTYAPAGHDETQLPPSKIGKSALGHDVHMHLCAVHVVHCELSAPLHVLQDEWQGTQV